MKHLLIGNQVYTPKVGRHKNPHEDVALVRRRAETARLSSDDSEGSRLWAMDVAVKRFITEVRSKGKSSISFF
jgi:hypothetical protein